MKTVFVVHNLEGEPLAIFDDEKLARRWLEHHVRKDIAKGYYGHTWSPEFTWVDGALGFTRERFGVYGWHAASDQIREMSLNPELET